MSHPEYENAKQTVNRFFNAVSALKEQGLSVEKISDMLFCYEVFKSLPDQKWDVREYIDPNIKRYLPILSKHGEKIYQDEIMVEMLAEKLDEIPEGRLACMDLLYPFE
ncbi:MAG: hypothetical protein KDJ35_06700 [Alphaproteobacteria bacterium]|nr:hypothetical protein [Alphaproteobacteria bacterium]